MKIDCLILTIGIKGMDNQSIALAKYLGLNFRAVNIKVNPLIKYFPLLGEIFETFFFKYFRVLEKYKFKYLITTGKKLSGVSIVLKKKYGKEIINLHIQKPPFKSDYFDVLIVPEHDNFSSKNFNIKIIGSLSFFKEKEIKEYYHPIKNKFKDFSSPNVLLMLGGKNKRYSPTYTDYLNILQSVKKAAEKISCNVIICTSRRTSEKVPYLANIVFSNFKFKKYIYVNEEVDIYPGILEICDYVIVTSDSVNMISEIASTSKSLYIASFKNNDFKLKLFHKKIIDTGCGKYFKNNLKKYKKNKLNNENIINKEFRNILKILSK